MKRIIYKVYEISTQHKEHGILLKTFLDKKTAYKHMEKSIFRYIKEDYIITF